MQLQTIEALTLHHCGNIQKWIETLDLSFKTIPEVSAILVDLYRLQRELNQLDELNPKHEVVDYNGKVIGKLHDNEKVEGVLLATNISVNHWVRSCEWHIGVLTSRFII